jgi:hypothetical protein
MVDEQITSRSNRNDFTRILGSDKHMINSKPLPITPNKQYGAACKILGTKGKPLSVFFGIFILNQYGHELIRRWKWVNDFDGKEREYRIIFTAPPDAKSVVLGYRINEETISISVVDIEFQNVDTLLLEELDGTLKDSYDEVHGSMVPTLTSLTKEEEERIEENMVWIFGSPRSGTTWLGRDLLSYNSQYWHEPYIGWHLSEFKEWRYRADYFFSYTHKNNWIHLLRKLILMRTYSQVLSFDRRIIIKEPNGSSAAEILMECFPKSKMIFLLRDGRDVIDSIIDSYRPGSWINDDPAIKIDPLKDEKAKLEAIRLRSEVWKTTIEVVKKAFDNHDQKLRLLVRYEDLRKNTAAELKKIYQFLGIQLDNTQIEKLVQKYAFEAIPEHEKGVGKFYRSASPGAWQQNFNDTEKALINSILGSTLKELGYSL